ncbi:hypothetical protein D3C85_1404920 [compost metagenome]
MLPAWSSLTTVKLCSPSISGVPGVKLQLPLPSTNTLPNRPPLSEICTVLPGSPLPDKVGVVSSVEPPLLTGLCRAPTSSVAASIPGLPGATVSTVRSKIAVGALSPLASVVTVAVSSCAPLPSSGAVKLQLPDESATTEPSNTPAS